jgi:hypothetical protein
MLAVNGRAFNSLVNVEAISHQFTDCLLTHQKLNEVYTATLMYTATENMPKQAGLQPEVQWHTIQHYHHCSAMRTTTCNDFN